MPAGLGGARLLLEQERGHVPVDRVGALVGLDQGGDDAAAQAVGQPHLLAVDDVLVTFLGRAALDRRDVGSAVRLAHRERTADLAGRHPGQEVLLLLVGAVLADHVRDDEVGVDHAADAHPAAGDLLDDQGVRQQRLAETAVLLRDHEAEQPHLLHPFDDRVRELVLVLEIGGVRQDLLVHEGPHGRQDFLLDVAQSVRLCQAAHFSLLVSVLLMLPRSAPFGAYRQRSERPLGRAPCRLVDFQYPATLGGSAH